MTVDLSGCFTGTLAHFAGTVRPAGGVTPMVKGDELLEPGTLALLLGRFAQRHPGGDRRALVSMWSQWHFGAVLVPAVVALLVAGCRLPVRFAEARFMLHADGRTAAVALPGLGPLQPERAGQGFVDLLEGHVMPLIRQLVAQFGVSNRLLFVNAAVSIDWTVRQCLERDDVDREAAAEIQAMLAADSFADGTRNLMQGALKTGEAEGDPQRRICCLRYCLPGMVDCGSFCPLPACTRSAAAARREATC